MTQKTANIHINIQPELKDKAEQVFAATGHTASEAIEQFYAWTARHHRTPMKLKDKRISVPVEDDLTPEEIRQLLAEAKAEIERGEYYTTDDIKAMLKEKRYATRV